MTRPDNNNIDPLTEAMSVLDSLGGADIGGDDDNAFDFAIDSDDDENENENNENETNANHEEEERNISDFSFGDLDDTLNLEDIDVNDSNASSDTAALQNLKTQPEVECLTAQSESDMPMRGF